MLLMIVNSKCNACFSVNHILYMLYTYLQNHTIKQEKSLEKLSMNQT